MPADKRHTVEGYWDCQYCGTTGIRGRFSSCPSCGHGRDASVRFYLKERDEAHAITREEFQREQAEANKNSRSDSANYTTATQTDGPSLYDRREGEGRGDEHDAHDSSDWFCDFCDSYNPATTDVCLNCGATREMSSGKTYADVMGTVARTYDAQGNLISERDLSKRSEKPTPEPRVQQKKRQPSPFGRIARILIIAFGVFVVLGLLGMLLFPSTKKIEVAGFEWERTIAVEEFKTVDESDWNLPSEARLDHKTTEIRTYEQVLDHYEEVPYQVSEQVLDHYETYTTEVDNGDGTFDVESHSEPVYRTEYHTEYRTEPVYVSVPIYDTKYYYQIEKWIHTRDIETAGTDHTPVWGELDLVSVAIGDYGTGVEREGGRDGHYFVNTSEGDRYEADEEFWDSLSEGQELEVKVDGSHISPKEDE